MSDYDKFTDYDLAPNNHVVNVDDTYYLVQGELNDQLVIHRPWSSLLKCEKQELGELERELE